MTLERDAVRSPVEELDAQVERVSMFTQAVVDQVKEHLSSAQAQIVELAEALVGRGAVDPTDLPTIARHIVTEAARAEQAEVTADGQPMADMQKVPWPNVAIRHDTGLEEVNEPVNCAERLAVCKAVCCTLQFPLSVEEIEKRVVKWDLGHPYVIRHRSDGWCTHNDPATSGCEVYADRPGVCHRYTCRHDSRIWSDFDNMVLNEAALADRSRRGALTLTRRGAAPPPPEDEADE